MPGPIPASTPGSAPASDSATTPNPERREQRQHPRFRVEGATAALGKEGFLASLGLGPRKDAVVNISQGGVLVRTSKAISVGTRLALRIEVEKFREVITCEGEVRWCGQSAKSDSEFYAGFCFVRIDPAQQKKIAHMQELLASVEYRAKSQARKDASSGHLKAIKP
jgi:hypothetical protein